MCTHTCTCSSTSTSTSTDTLHKVRGLCARLFSTTPPCRQPHSIFGGTRQSDGCILGDHALLGTRFIHSLGYNYVLYFVCGDFDL